MGERGQGNECALGRSGNGLPNGNEPRSRRAPHQHNQKPFSMACTMPGPSCHSNTCNCDADASLSFPNPIKKQC